MIIEYNFMVESRRRGTIEVDSDFGNEMSPTCLSGFIRGTGFDVGVRLERRMEFKVNFFNSRKLTVDDVEEEGPFVRFWMAILTANPVIFGEKGVGVSNLDNHVVIGI